MFRIRFEMVASRIQIESLPLLPLFGQLYQARMIDDDVRGAVGGMTVTGNCSTQIKPAWIWICPPQIPHDLTRIRKRAAKVGSRRLTYCAMASQFWGS
jgi:hypothetical protein